MATIRHLHAMTKNVLLVESVTFPGQEPIMALVDEGRTEDQGLNHLAFYPTESCLVKMLYRAGYSDVYGFRSSRIIRSTARESTRGARGQCWLAD